jgi:hypothetical protein
MKMRFICSGIALAGFSTLAVGAGCGHTDSPIGFQGGVLNGQECGPIGSTAPASDGCNTCKCGGDHRWGCTLTDCSVRCTDGQTKPAGDGCNTCTCSPNHEWVCTLTVCPPPVCTPGETKLVGGGCNACVCQSNGQWSCTVDPCNCPAPRTLPMGTVCAAVTAYARNPAGPECCFYGYSCYAPEGWVTFNSLQECLAAPQCPAPAPDDGRVCPQVIVYAKDPASGACCSYSDPCRAPTNWKTYLNEGECKVGP